jgi:hypothetical protein
MRRLLLLASLVLVGCGGHASMGGGGGTTPTPISISIQCQPGQTCPVFQVYRLQGACPANLNTSTGWTVIGTTSAAEFTDSNVVSGTTYSYDVEVLNGPVFSGPSNCISETAS